MNVVVIGGGVIGTTTAWYLARAGCSVTLVEKERELAAACSHANGGMLHAGNTEPWNTPDVFAQLLRWIGREDSPLLLRPSQLPHLMGWGLGFLRYSRAHHHRRSTRRNTRLAVYSQQMMANLGAHTGIAYNQAHTGIAKIFRSHKELRHAINTADLIASLGVDFRVLDADELVALEPALADIHAELAGGIYYPDDASGDPCLFTQHLGKLAADNGVALRLGEAVTAIDTNKRGIEKIRTSRGELTADRYVLATGVDAPRMVRHLGIRLPIRPVKGYSATLPASGGQTALRIPIIDEGNKVVLTPLGECLRLAGTAEFAGLDDSISPRRIKTLMRQSLANLPGYAAAVDPADVQPWACLRPMTVDGSPILGKSPIPNLFLNVGSGHLGWTFAAGAAKVLADIVTDRTPAIDLEGLTYERF